MSITRSPLVIYGSKANQLLRRHCINRELNSGQFRLISNNVANVEKDADVRGNSTAEKEPGAMTQRLSQLTEEGLESGGHSARRAASEAGFNEDLRKQLEERIAGASITSSNPQASAYANLKASAGQGTRDIAGAAPWTGDEAPVDTALRMLTDAHKPLRGGKGRGSVPLVPPKMKTRTRSSGLRLADAKERSSVYTHMKAGPNSSAERQAMVNEMKARFEPGARDLPATLTGLSLLANQRIEEAMARGQFRNIPRGKQIERDHRSNSPFIDTTEYIMNKMIKKQDIVPPWIEKQQEITSAARMFRLRLRNDWRRHAARSISAAGGSVETQIQKAREYAAAEIDISDSITKQSPSERPEDHLSHILLNGELSTQAEQEITQPSTTQSSPSIEPPQKHPTPPSTASPQEQTTSPATSSPPPKRRLPFRDPAWQATEHTFHTLSIANLNSLTRSYNLIAPQIAQRPYFNLDRELKACFTEVAPQIAGEIRQRAMAPRTKYGLNAMGIKKEMTILERVQGQKANVFDEDLGRKGYGFKQFWKELWAKPA